MVSSAFKKLRQRRKEWANECEKNGFLADYLGLRNVLHQDDGRLLFELIQNAENASATWVRITLSEDKLVFEHNGRLFDLEDVEAITKPFLQLREDDPLPIGKFGAGFKLVFAYTTSPEVHSGGFHFRIEDMVVPVPIESRNSTNDWKTTIILPFNHPASPPKQVVDEIQHCLDTLTEEVLLFFTHLFRVEYVVRNGTTGSMDRVDRSENLRKLQRCRDGEVNVSNWVRYHAKEAIFADDTKSVDCEVAVAFRLEEYLDKWQIVPLNHGKVFFYFPFKNEVSELKFHVHAFFASTLAGRSMRVCDANNKLRDRLIQLITNALENICDQGLLDFQFLAVLPNLTDKLSAFYKPIRDAIFNEFREKRLTPTQSGRHLPAKKLLLGEPKIIDLFNDNDLANLLGRTPPLWCAIPSGKNPRESEFLDNLEMERFGWVELRDKLWVGLFLVGPEEENYERAKRWIASKDDQWMMKLYAQLGDWTEPSDQIWSDSIIVRVEKEKKVDHVKPDIAYFRPHGKVSWNEDIWFVKESMLRANLPKNEKEKASSFLKAIGVKEFGPQQLVTELVSRYSKQNTEPEKEYFEALDNFITESKKRDENNSEEDGFIANKFLCGELDSGELIWCHPFEICVDAPFRNTGLASLVDIHQRHTLWKGYHDRLTVQIEDFIRFLERRGAMTKLVVTKDAYEYLPYLRDNIPPRVQELLERFPEGTRLNKKCYFDNYKITKIEEYVSSKSVTASLLLWAALIQADPKTATLRFRPNASHDPIEEDADWIKILKTKPWLPDRKGVFRKPSAMTRRELQDGFKFDDGNGLLTAIGFGKGTPSRKRKK